MIKKILATLMITATFFSTSIAQDSTKTLSFSGSIDGYYRHNFANASDGINSNNRTSFTNSQGAFSLEKSVAYAKGKFDFLAEAVSA